MDNTSLITLGGILLIIAAVIWCVVGIVVLIRTGKSPDEAATIKLNELSNNAEVIREIRLAYQHSTDTAKELHRMGLAVLSFLAPLTPGKADDAARDLLDKFDDAPAVG